jgi:glutamate formiminotransferase/formiminotetrahydrofolate cyclodeaminase
MKKLIECVPNFSEGRDMGIIKQITDAIESVEGIRLLDVDPGKATNRTVVTFVGEPEPVIEAAFRAMKKASEVIDMTKHKGEHPRFGATDVCPLVPIANISMEETAEYARKLAKRAGEELQYPIFCYEFAATSEKRKNLASVRSGEYEGLEQKLANPDWNPDFGPAQFVPKTGATAVGARNFLVAYNVNLNTTSTRRANSIAFDVREAGRVKREGDSLTGKIVKDENGKQIRIPGTLKKVKAIGWYIEEFGVAQISMNLTDISVTPVHIAFDEVCKSAQSRGLRVTGSELVGLIPLQSILDAGKYFLTKQKRSLGIPEDEIIKIAVKSLGLDEVKPFNPNEKIIEYILDSDTNKKLVNLPIWKFADETSSESPAPGGGSISAYLGVLGVSLGVMVANLSAQKRGWDDRWEDYSKWAEKGQKLKKELLILVDEDTAAFNSILEAYQLPKTTDGDKLIRNQAIQAATKKAIEVPFKIMKLASESMQIMKAMAETGLEASVSDAGVGALAARAGISGAFLNVKINLPSLDDKEFAKKVLDDATKIEKYALESERDILEIVNQKISK